MIDKYNDYLKNNDKINKDLYNLDNITNISINNKIEKDVYMKSYGIIPGSTANINDLNTLRALRGSLSALRGNISTITQVTTTSLPIPDKRIMQNVPLSPPVQLPVRQVKPQQLPKVEDTTDHNFLQQFMNDMFSKSRDGDFRGWILPNGELISQYSNERGARQDHSKLIKLFLSGLQEFDSETHSKVMDLYDKYVANNYDCFDIYESFAVEVLGWMQVSEFGSKRISCRGERWQDKYIGPFINGFGFYLNFANNGECYNHLFPNMYDNTRQIFTLGLEKTNAATAARAV